MTDPVPEELARFLAANPQIKRFDLLLPDINGMLRGVRASREDMPRVFTHGAFMSASTMLLDSRGMLPEGLDLGRHDGDPDFACLPVAGSLRPVPWSERALGQCLVQMQAADNQPYHYDSRHVLQRVLAQFATLGLRPVVALELEFYLLAGSAQTPPTPRRARIPGTDWEQQAAQLHSLEELLDIDEFLADVETACAAQGIPIGNFMSEGSPGQYEINLQHIADAELACDHAILLRRLVRGVALRHGMAATFMAKPFSELDGSGMHLHFSLLDAEGRNVFAESATEGAASCATLRHAVGGLLATLPETLAILAPNANSYRRFARAEFVSATPSWGTNHRGVAIRIPPSDALNRRLEYRPAGADCNPYLVVAAVLAGALHGIRERIAAPAMITESQTVEQQPDESLHWQGALTRFENAAVLPAFLGADFCAVYARCRRLEATHYHAQVPDLDYRWYLGNI